MSFARIRGQTRALNFLRRALDAGRLPHALLFSGPDGVGKRRTALELAKAMNCTDLAAGKEACDACPSCRMVDRGTHPDILLVAPEGRRLKIDQVRQVERHAALSPYAGGRRVAILDAADSMTPQAQNAFLKTLEEPPSAAVLILISSASTSLLATVRSRCQEVRFAALPEEVVAGLLAQAGVDPEEARRAAALSGGSVSRASLWAERLPRGRQDDLLRQTWSSLASPGRALAWAEKLNGLLRPERGRLEGDLVPLVLLLLGTWARNLARSGRPGAGAEGEDAWPGQGAVSPRAALGLYEAVGGAQVALDREVNVNLRLALEAMLLRMRAALASQASP